MSEAFAVPDALAGERVDRAVALLTGWSRSEIQALLADELVLVGGRVIAKSRRVRSGEVIELLAEPAPPSLPTAEHLAIDIRHADEHVVVVAKAAGMVVHPGAGNPAGTLVNALLAPFPEIATVGDPFRPGIVHRLDRETSGLLVVARSDLAYESLVAQLKARAVERCYDALVWGEPASRRGVIDAPIGRSAHRRTRMAVREDGRDARTGYEVVRTWRRPAVAQLECRLETGRTHQIRVHLAAIGHPVVGDGTYNGRRDNVALGRPFLHARVLGFVHPESGRALRFEEPLPPDLAAVLATLDSA